MDIVKFSLEDNSYDIELKKIPRTFGYSIYGNYICTLSFLDKLGIPQVIVKGNEKQFYEFMNILNDYNSEYMSYNDCITYFTAGETQMMIYVSTSQAYQYPTEEDDKLFLHIFEDSFQGRTSLLFLEFNFYFLEDLIYHIYQLLEDIPYLRDIGYSSLLEQMGLYDEYRR